MKKILVLSLIVLCGPSCKRPEYSDVYIDSGVKEKSLTYKKDIKEKLEKLAVEYKDKVSVLYYGELASKNTLFMLKIAQKHKLSTKRHAVLITGGTHGNEYLNIVDRLPLGFLQAGMQSGFQQFLSQGGIVYIVPIVNPDGFDLNTRENSRKSDLNRGYPLKRIGKPEWLKGIETIYLRKIIDEELKKENAILGLFMDYHCCVLPDEPFGPTYGALLHPWSYPHDTFKASNILKTGDLRQHEIIGKIARETLDKDIKIGSAINIVKYDSRGDSLDYFFETYMQNNAAQGIMGASFTYEGIKGKGKNDIQKHLDFWNRILGYLSTEDLTGVQ